MQNSDAKHESHLAAVLASLSQTIATLAPLATSEGQRADVQLLQIIAARLHRSVAAAPLTTTTTGLQHYEPERFRRLLDLAGPRHAPELLARLAEDLADTRTKTATSATLRDWSTLRAASHVLISLAGSVGALSLHRLAERLNLAAQTPDEPAIADLIPATLAELDALITIVATTSPDDQP